MSVNSSKRPVALRKLLPAAAVIVAVAAFDQPVAYAGNGFLGGFVGGVVGGAIGRMLVEPRYHYAPSYRSEGRPSRSRNASGASGGAPQAPPSPADSSRALASLAPPTPHTAQSAPRTISIRSARMIMPRQVATTPAESMISSSAFRSPKTPSTQPKRGTLRSTRFSKRWRARYAKPT